MTRERVTAVEDPITGEEIEIPDAVMERAEKEAEISGADPERLAVAMMMFHPDEPRGI